MYTIYSKWVKSDPTVPQGSYVSFVMNNETIGYGFYEKLGAIGARIIAYKSEAPSNDFREIVRWRIAKAYRLRIESGEKNENGYRLLYADSDGVPGLIADVYNDTTVIQSTSKGWDRHSHILAQEIVDMGVSKKVFLKNDQRARKKLGLPIKKLYLVGRPPTRTTIREGDVDIIVDYSLGHKTGFYLDQRGARLRVGRMRLEGFRVLDLFAYTGAFSLQALSAGASEALMVEENADAVRLADENLRRNGYRGRYQIIRGRVEKFLDRLAASKKRFDMVIVDPPSFIPSPEVRERGLRAYEKLYKKAITVTRHGGYIYASSCSFHLKKEELLEILRESSYELGHEPRVIYEHTPINSNPYTRIQDNELRYLKGFLLRLD